MIVSEKLAAEFHTILFSHVVMLTLLILFTAYVYFRAKKSQLLVSYLLVVGMIALWMVAKILKTVSPQIEMRWFFIVVQYWAIDSLGFFLLIFSRVYQTNRLPSKRTMIAWAILPLGSFIVLATNPLHMTFYTYFDIYKDRFGLSFYAAQSIHYLYLFTGIAVLSRGYMSQPGFHGKKGLGRIFSALVSLPLIANIYYILFKMDLFEWIFPFPVFDFTPIAASISLMLFVIPTLRFRFFDVSPITLSRLYDLVPQGLVFVDQSLHLYDCNRTFLSIFLLKRKPESLETIFMDSAILDEAEARQLIALIQDENQTYIEIALGNEKRVHVQKHVQKNDEFLLCVTDITEISRSHQQLKAQNLALEQINNHLNSVADTTRALAVARTKSQMAQNVHDILGHSLTVVIGTAELAASDDVHGAMQKTLQIEELLTGSLNDLKNALDGKGLRWGETSLIKAIQHLKNEKISVRIQTQGKTYELSTTQTEAVYRLCQEAVTNAIKHGKASHIYLILRFSAHFFEIYAIDNGRGCREIKKNYGLEGIENRVTALTGQVSFVSDGESGFTIHAKLPVPLENF